MHIKLAETKGGTELGMRLNTQVSDWSQADFTKATSRVHVEGTLTLNYVNVRCLADINLNTLGSNGHLQNLEQ